MTFEEFFKKKRIDIAALQAGKADLFSEFKIHFGEMGEKSFDHSKKYWFNKLRHQFPLAPEVKTEKAAIANSLAEQTITESLIEGASVPASPKLGFAPKFKAANPPKPAVAAEEKKELAETSLPLDVNTQAETPKPEPAYKPRFKMKPKEATEEPKPIEQEKVPDNAIAKQLYKPRINMENIPPKDIS